MDFHHFCDDLVFVESGPHYAHGFEVGVDREVNGALKKGNFAGRFDLAQGGDLRANVLQFDLRRDLLEPVHDFFLVRVAAQFFFVGKNRVDARIGFRQALDGGAHFRERFYGCEAGAGFDAGIGVRHAHTVPLFFSRIFAGKVEDFVRGMRCVAAG